MIRSTADKFLQCSFYFWISDEEMIFYSRKLQIKMPIFEISS